MLLPQRSINVAASSDVAQWFIALKMEMESSYETSVNIYHSTTCYLPVDGHFTLYENLPQFLNPVVWRQTSPCNAVQTMKWMKTCSEANKSLNEATKAKIASSYNTISASIYRGERTTESTKVDADGRSSVTTEGCAQQQRNGATSNWLSVKWDR
jgi:hypothetical protein